MATKATLALAGAFIVSGCGNPKPVSAPLSESQGSDQVAKSFEFDAKREGKLDQSALDHEATAPAHSVVTLYFEGGLSRNCARWDFKIKGEDLAVARGEKLDEEHQKLLQKKDDGSLFGSFDTRGGLEGLRLLASTGSRIRLTGVQDFCLTKDATEFDVKIDVKSQRKLQRLFTGVEAPGQTAVRYRVTDQKAESASASEDSAASGPDAKASAGN